MRDTPENVDDLWMVGRDDELTTCALDTLYEAENQTVDVGQS